MAKAIKIWKPAALGKCYGAQGGAACFFLWDHKASHAQQNSKRFFLTHCILNLFDPTTESVFVASVVV